MDASVIKRSIHVESTLDWRIQMSEATPHAETVFGPERANVGARVAAVRAKLELGSINVNSFVLPRSQGSIHEADQFSDKGFSDNN